MDSWLLLFSLFIFFVSFHIFHILHTGFVCEFSQQSTKLQFSNPGSEIWANNEFYIVASVYYSLSCPSFISLRILTIELFVKLVSN